MIYLMTELHQHARLILALVDENTRQQAEIDQLKADLKQHKELLAIIGTTVLELREKTNN